MGHVGSQPRSAEHAVQVDSRLALAVVVCFQNEAEHLPTLLQSIDAQTEPADQVVLVDDGSDDKSPSIVAAYERSRCEVRVVTRERRSAERDRLADAPELRAFAAGVAALDRPWDAVAKIDGDLELSPTLFADVRARFRADPALGITGS